MNEPINARHAARCWWVYREFLWDNNIDDDSKWISVEDCLDYLKEELAPGEFQEYYSKCPF